MNAWKDEIDFNIKLLTAICTGINLRMKIEYCYLNYKYAFQIIIEYPHIL